jgi:hypothetical protein
MLNLPDCKIDGEFCYGVLCRGTVITPLATYRGEFDESGKLHGAACVKSTKEYSCEGYFEHGQFKHGTMLQANCVFSGTFGEHGIEFGTYSRKNISYTGTFFRGKLVDGVCEIKYNKHRELHKGKFDGGILKKGSVISHNGKFVSMVEFDDKGALAVCETRCGANINEMTRNQIILLLANGEYCREVSTVFMHYMTNFTVLQLFGLDFDMLYDFIYNRSLDELDSIDFMDQEERAKSENDLKEASFNTAEQIIYNLSAIKKQAIIPSKFLPEIDYVDILRTAARGA